MFASHNRTSTGIGGRIAPKRRFQKEHHRRARKVRCVNATCGLPCDSSNLLRLPAFPHCLRPGCGHDVARPRGHAGVTGGRLLPSQRVPVRSCSRRHRAPTEVSTLRSAGAAGRKTFAPRAVPPPLIERIERALMLAAYVVVRHGPVYAPLLERLEKELQTARRNDPTERAKRILKDHGDSPMRRGAPPRCLAPKSSSRCTARRRSTGKGTGRTSSRR
jgi:hypothetical protein